MLSSKGSNRSDGPGFITLAATLSAALSVPIESVAILERGTRGAPEGFEFNGNIDANGNANLSANGVTREEVHS